MNYINEYKTIESYMRTELVVKKSKFITSVCPVQNEEEAICFINKIKKEFYDARHNVFAYQIGLKNEIQRCTDDGEPSGTSGAPTLDVLKKNNITNAIIVTTRYFGGTLLGTGGLVRAYGQSASKCIDASNVIHRKLFTKIHLSLNYVFSGKIGYILKQNNVTVEDILYTDVVTYVLLVDKTNFSLFEHTIIEATNSNVDIKIIGDTFYTI